MEPRNLRLKVTDVHAIQFNGDFGELERFVGVVAGPPEASGALP